MWKDLLQTIKGLIGAKKTAPEKVIKPVNPSAAKKAEPATNTANRTNLIFIVATLVITVIVYMAMMHAPGPDTGTGAAESVIPLAQLTGKIGAQPRNDTLEQQFRRENKNTPLSDGSTIPKAVVAERTQLFRQIPFGDTELAYEMRLPKHWGQSKFTQYGTPGSEKYEVITNIDRFFGPPTEDKRPFVWLEVQRLNRAAMAQYYMDQYFIDRGVTPESIKVYGPAKAEALYVATRDYVTYAMRSLFIMNGDRMVTLTFAVPMEDYGAYRDVMGLSLNSFRLLHKIGREPEPKTSYKLLNVLSFDYLKRWIPRNENRTSSLSPSVELVLPTELALSSYYSNVETQNQIEGLILINGWRNTPGFNRDVIEQTLIKRLALGGLKLREVLVPEKELSPQKDIPKISQAIYIGVVDQTVPTTEEFGLIRDETSFPRQEVWVTVMDNGDYTAVVTLVTWPQTKNYRQWAANTVAYQTILNTLKLRKLGF